MENNISIAFDHSFQLMMSCDDTVNSHRRSLYYAGHVVSSTGHVRSWATISLRSFTRNVERCSADRCTPRRIRFLKVLDKYGHHREETGTNFVCVSDVSRRNDDIDGNCDDSIHVDIHHNWLHHYQNVEQLIFN